ncbi:putative disease resistance protein RGA3 [Alnus glutinosa]|uniref:putative disease resistance protein RGA3 n=1 Tax=Alnus glutinosa TaxID=3517 RepID=UPI002D76FF22|nr:putative disease resistance protein RGA3 [Alnus glutinosa]
MHDLIHDLAQSISSPNCCQVKGNELYSFSEQSRHVSLLGKDVEQPMLEIVNNAKKLRTLLLPSGHLKTFGQALDKVFRTLQFIRGLDLSSSQISKLPDSIEELKLLRYLNLSRTEISVLPNSICNLFNLQTLKLLGCAWLSALPKDLGNLVNLQHLELDAMFWFKLSMLPPNMGNLTSLHNLPVFQVGDKNGYGVEQLEKMAYLSGKLHISNLENAVNARDAKLNEKKSLVKLVFEWSDRVVNTQDEATESSLLEDLQPHSNIRELQIIRYRGNEFPAWIQEGRLQNLVSLTLNGCIKCKTLALGQLPKLQALYIKGMQELEKWTEVEICHSLSSLKLSNCPDLRELPSIFPNLQVLKIKSCNSLRALPVTPFLHFLILIDNLILEDWNEVNLVLEDTPFINLIELKVTGCPKLQALPEIFFPQKLEISRCDLLTTLPPPPHAQHLQHLAVDGCHDGALVRAIPDTSSLYSLVVSSISNISSLPKWPQLPGLKASFIHDCKDLMSLSNGEEGSLRTLTSLNLLSIRNCQMLETLNEDLPTSLECLSITSCPLLKSFSLENLPSLKDLYIEDCPMLQSLPEDGLPNSLKHLQIKTCPLLTEQCQREGGGGPDWPKIAEIPDLDIDSHIVIPSTSVPN